MNKINKWKCYNCKCNFAVVSYSYNFETKCIDSVTLLCGCEDDKLVTVTKENFEKFYIWQELLDIVKELIKVESA